MTDQSAASTQPDRPGRSITPPGERIPFAQKAAYAVGMFVNNLQAAALPILIVVLNLGFGMDPVLVGIIAAVPRIVDAVTDPLIGYISDNTRLRWGRRRPYILWGAVVSGLVFAGMWQLPKGLPEMHYLWVVGTASIVYFLTYSTFSTPLIALGYELTSDYHERTRLQAYAHAAGQLVWIGSPWFYGLLASALFVDIVQGAHVFALWIGGAISVLGIVPALVCRERYAPRSGDGAPGGQSRRSAGFLGHVSAFFSGLVSALKCRPFRMLCSATFLVFNGFQLGSSFTLYVVIYYVFLGDDRQAGVLFGAFGMLRAVCTFAAIPLTVWISSRVGKRDALLITISISLIGYALKWLGFDPQHPYLLLISCPFVAFGVGPLHTLMGSMVADVCDYDELTSRERREGVFGAIYWWMVKVGMAMAGLLTGILLKTSGFDVALASGQSEKTLFLLRLFDVGIPFVTSLVAIWIMSSYNITEEAAYRFREKLDGRETGPDDAPDSGDTA